MYFVFGNNIMMKSGTRSMPMLAAAYCRLYNYELLYINLSFTYLRKNVLIVTWWMRLIQV